MRLPVDDISDNNDGTKTIWMRQPYYGNALAMGDFDENHKWIPRYDVPFYVENAKELLDKPGEWYYDANSQELFYYPKEGQEIQTSEFVIPQQLYLLNINGKNVEDEVHDIVFDGITFAYAGWTRASKIGTFGWQAQNLLPLNIQGDYETTPAHINVNHANKITFKKCQFIHMGAIALHLNNNVHDSTIEGNLFYDISDSAIMIGHWNHDYITSPLIQAPSQFNKIQNNLISQIGREYWGSPAIAAYYVNNIDIIHNEINQIPGTGISVGWGWSSETDSTTCHDNHIAQNSIIEIAQKVTDGGGIYTLGQQPGTVIEENVVQMVGNNEPCYYTDEGSAFITLNNNLCDSAGLWYSAWIDTIHDIEVQNTYTNVNGILNKGKNINIINTTYVDGQHWPERAEALIEESGLEQNYFFLNNGVGH